MKCLIKGDTTVEGITLLFVDNEIHKRTTVDIPFNDYFYIGIEDFQIIKDELKQRFKDCLLKAVEHKATNGNFVKIFLKDNTKKFYIMNFLDERDIKHYIMDLDATKHYTITHFDELEYNLNHLPYLFYDIETDDRKDFKYDEYGRVVPENTILTFCAIDNEGNRYELINQDSNNPACEIILLQEISKVFEKYGLASAWNGSMFDDIYLSGRCKHHNIQDFTKQINKIDYLFTYKKYRIETTLESYALNNVAKEELNDEKLDVKGGGGRIYNLYLTDKKRLLEYNLQDVDLLYRINKKLKFIELHLMTASLAKCRVDLTNYNIGSNDYFILIEAYKRNIVAPSAPTKEEIERRKRLGSIGGGFTRGFVRSFQKNVATFDFNSLYPSLEITFNISPETYVMSCTTKDKVAQLEPMHKHIKVFDNEEALNDYCKQNNYIRTFDTTTYVAKRGKYTYHPYRIYRQDNGIGMLPSSMIESIKIRADIKKQLKTETDPDKKDMLYLHQLAVKYILNSAYGLNASPVYRYFNWDLCDSITANGQAIIKLVDKYLTEELKCIVIYNDTDSAGFVKTRDDLTYEQINSLVEDFIDKTLEVSNNNVYKRENTKGRIINHRLIMEYEKLFNTLLYQKKKRYAGRIGDKLKVVGLESTQMNILAATLQDEFLKDAVLNETFDKYKWKQKIDELYTRCFKGGLTVDELSISKKYSQSIEAYNGTVTDKKTGTAKIKKDGTTQYKSIPAHIELVKRLLSQGKEIYIGDKIQYIIKTASPKQYVITKEEFEQCKEYDKEHYWELIIRPLMKLIGLYDKDIVFEIINVPERQKIIDKIKELTTTTKQTTLFNDSVIEDPRLEKLKDRLERLESDLLANDIDENEIDD